MHLDREFTSTSNDYFGFTDHDHSVKLRLPEIFYDDGRAYQSISRYNKTYGKKDLLVCAALANTDTSVVMVVCNPMSNPRMSLGPLGPCPTTTLGTQCYKLELIHATDHHPVPPPSSINGSGRFGVHRMQLA